MPEREQPRKVFSGDQAGFSQWDSLVKLHGARAAGVKAPIGHQFHLADTFGKGNEDNDSLHLTHETYRFRDGKEIQPSWFAVTETWPAFPRNPIVPFQVGNVLGERFEGFARSTEQQFAKLPAQVAEEVKATMAELGYPPRLPKQMQDVYELLTSGNIKGLADAVRRSASSYHFSEMEDLQRKLLLGLYGETARMVHPDDKEGLKERFREIVDKDGPFYNAAHGKSLPELARDVFTVATERVEEITGVGLGDVEISDTNRSFTLTTAEGEVVDEPERFTFLNWYLNNRELYSTAHNEISEELSQRGENPIQTLAVNRGETPFWVIIDGKKNKLYLDDKSDDPQKEKVIKVVLREGKDVREDVIPVEKHVENHEELGEIFARQYPGKDVTVIPTALGLALHLRANGDMMLPEHGSHYIHQLDMTYNRMQLAASADQEESMIGQNSIFRVHPHALSSLPEGKKIKMPSHLHGAFPTDEQGYTTTDVVKATWKEVAKHQTDTVKKASEAESLLDKARILFTDLPESTVHNILGRLEVTAVEEELRREDSTAVMDYIKNHLDKSQLKLLGAVSAYTRGKSDTLPEGNQYIDEKAEDLARIREEFTKTNELLTQKANDEAALKFLVALRGRQLLSGADTLEYFDARPSLLTMYLMFGEEGVRNVIHSAEVYRAETPRTVEKHWYSAEGNKLLVVHDKTGDNGVDKKKALQSIVKRIEADGYDTAMVLSPTDDKDADFMVTQVMLDGTTGGMCGNGIRSIGKYAYDNLGKDRVRMVTDTGDRVEGFFDGEKYGAKLQSVVLTKNTIKRFEGLVDSDVLASEDHVKTITFAINNALYANEELQMESVNVLAVTSVSGEPHIVLEIDDLSDHERINAIAKAINEMPTEKGKKLFPHDINVSFVVRDPEQAKILTHERGGPGITGACGTGSISILSVLRSEGINDATFKTPAGYLKASYDGTYYTIKGGVDEL